MRGEGAPEIVQVHILEAQHGTHGLPRFPGPVERVALARKAVKDIVLTVWEQRDRLSRRSGEIGRMRLPVLRLGLQPVRSGGLSAPAGQLRNPVLDEPSRQLLG
jgi:hypothetical protein